MARLRDQGNYGHARVSTNNRHLLIRWICTLDLRDEAGSTDDVKSGNAEDTLRVVNILGFKDLSNNGNSRVDLCASLSLRNWASLDFATIISGTLRGLK